MGLAGGFPVFGLGLDLGRTGVGLWGWRGVGLGLDCGWNV